MSLILSGTDGLSDVDGSAATPAIRGTDANTGIFFPSADTIAFAEGGAEVARFDSSGNFGLGVTPNAWQVNNRAIQLLEGYASISSNNSQGCCDVASNCFNAGSAATSGWKYTNTGVAVSLFQQQAGAFKFLTAASGTAGNAITFTQAMTLDASGNLGLGATSVTSAFEIYRDTASGTSTAYPNIKLNNNNASGYTGLYFFNGATSKAGFELKNDVGALTIQTANAERARITSGGNFLVGTTSTDSSLANFVDSSATSGAIIRASAGSASFTGSLFVGYGARASTNGSYYLIQVLNGNDSGRFQVLDSGNCQNTNNSYGAISDVKLKENIVDATPKLERLNQVRVVNYNLIGSEQKQLGVIAQELEQIFPGMVEETPDRDKEGNDLGTTTKSVKYSVFVPMLIKAIQEQQAIITQLTARITALESA